MLWMFNGVDLVRQNAGVEMLAGGKCEREGGWEGQSIC